jgi:uncharacterized membrane protein YedE/YeeE
MRLKTIGAAIILFSFLFAAIAMRISRPYTWLDKNWPLIMFAGLVFGGAIGVIGMRAGANRRRQDSN